jgi:hypothetical protein
MAANQRLRLWLAGRVASSGTGEFTAVNSAVCPENIPGKAHMVTLGHSPQITLFSGIMAHPRLATKRQ